MSAQQSILERPAPSPAGPALTPALRDALGGYHRDVGPSAPRWIAGHVRHVMLAEAMVDEFAALFAGISVDEAARLADAFRFDRCTVREPLERILATATAATFPV